MATGFVTTTRYFQIEIDTNFFFLNKKENSQDLLFFNFSVVHATPSALYSHVPNRRWECESKIKPEHKSMGCKDIARQLIEDEPGRKINVIMGGGRQCLVSNVTSTKEDPIDTYSCYSSDGRNLIRDWATDKKKHGFSHSVVTNNKELENLNHENTDFVLG